MLIASASVTAAARVVAAPNGLFILSRPFCGSVGRAGVTSLDAICQGLAMRDGFVMTKRDGSVMRFALRCANLDAW
jgi:hypothetical protein